MDFVKDYTVEKLAGSEVKLTGEVPYAELAKHRAAAIAHLGQHLKLDGFRPGHIPEKVIVEKVGEMAILSEMAERALAKVYPAAVRAHELDVIGYPKIEITKIAPENPLGFTATVATLPEVTLPDYAAIAKERNAGRESTEVTDDELETQIKDILRQKVAYDRLQAKAAKKAATGAKQAPAEDGGVADLPTPETVAKAEEDEHVHDEHCDHDHDDAGGAADELPSDDELPALTDELVKTLGQPDQFESVDDFKAKLREHLTIEKEREVHAKHRAAITDAIIEKTTVALPQVLIDSELEQMFAQMNEDLARANLKLEDYLGHIKKSKEDLKAEWTPAAEKRAKLQLVLNEIAKAEHITPDAEQLEAQTKQLLAQYKDADESRVRIYVASVLTNEAVMQHLEAQQ